MKRISIVPSILYVLYLIFFLSTFCSFRVVTSISIGLILLLSIFQHKSETGLYVNRRLKNPLLVSCILFFVVQAIALIYTDDIREGLKHLSVKSGLVIIPLALCCSNYPDAQNFRKLMKKYCMMLAVIIMICLAVASWKYLFLNASQSVFFYHELLKPFNQHAIQFSILVFFGIIFLLETADSDQYTGNRFLHFFLTIIFVVFLILLSSKLVIVFLAFYIILYLYNFYKSSKRNNANWLLGLVIVSLMVIGGIFFTKNKVSDRFNEIISGDLSQIRRDKFDQGVYFNGLQFRLLQWRFVTEILNENKAWITGVGPGDAQAILDKKYRDTNMYIGQAGTGDRGFLGYNTHNQFLESLLQTGLAGLILFFAACSGMLIMAIRKRNRQLTAIVILLIAYSLNEAVFETQYGITLFTFLPLFMYYSAPDTTEGNKPGDMGG